MRDEGVCQHPGGLWGQAGFVLAFAVVAGWFVFEWEHMIGRGE
jgi:hypothetical protein